MGINHLSPSTCQSYRKCGKQVYLNKVLGIPNPQTYAMTVYGSAMHKAIEKLYKEKLDVKSFKQVFSDEWNKHNVEITNWKTDTETSLLEEGLTACQDFYDNIYGKFNVELVEQEFRIDRGNGNLPILCFADAITKDGYVIDYKFGRGLSGTANSAGYALNMATYAWGYKEKYGELPSKIIFVRQKWGMTKDPITKQRVYHHKEFMIDEMPVFEEDIDFYKDVYNNVEIGIQAGVWLPAEDESFLCKTCGYRLKGYCKKGV